MLTTRPALFTNSPLYDCEEEARELGKRNVEVVVAGISSIRDASASGLEVTLQSGETRFFDVIYSALGLQTNSHLAMRLGAQCDETGQICVDAHMQTNVPGLFASGDVATGLNQISVATGQSAIVSTAIHNILKVIR